MYCVGICTLVVWVICYLLQIAALILWRFLGDDLPECTTTTCHWFTGIGALYVIAFHAIIACLILVRGTQFLYDTNDAVFRKVPLKIYFVQ